MEWLNRSLVVSPYYFGLCLSERDFQKELKRLEIGRDERPPFLTSATAHATCHFFENKKLGKQIAIVCLGSTKGRPLVEIHGLLVHEAVHIWQAIRDHIGERAPSSEFEAYSIQGIAQELMHAYSEKRKK